MTRWLDPHPVIADSLDSLNLPPLIAQTLLRRGIRSPEEAEAFLHPDAIPSTPFPNIESAVERILLAIRNNEMVCVWGDFDVDGQTSTALLVQTFQALGANGLDIFFMFWNPYASVVTQRLRHECQLRLVITANRNARRVNLCKAWITECSTTLVRAPCSCHVATHRIGRKEEHVTITTGAKHNSMR